MTTPDNLLPVWPFQPNWREPITERLSWATVVMSSDSGSEQRYSSRLSPRREFEALFNPVDDTRTFFDLFISELGGQEMMIPLWHDRHKLTSAVTIGDSRIDCDTDYGEFTDGGMAIILGADAWSHQVVEIDTVDGTGFSLLVNTTFAWPIGGTILPLRRSRLDLQPSLSNITSRVSEVTLRFLLNQSNDLPDEGAWAGLTYGGYPVMTTESDWKNGIDIGFSRITETEDNGTGIAFIRDIADRAFRTKTHTWHLNGRQANWDFRQFLYRMAGRRTPIWMPTGAQDMVVAANAAAGANNVNVRQVGLTYIGGPQPGRDRFLVSTDEGYQVRRITGMGAPLLPSYERLNLDSNLTYALPKGTRLSFLEIMRADGDDIELLHHTDVEGVTECSINFRSFNDARVPATPISLPLPSSGHFPGTCSSPDPNETPCILPYNPWTLRIVFSFAGGALPTSIPGLFPAGLPQDVTAGMMPNGRTLAIGTQISNAGGWDDFDYPSPTGEGVNGRAILDNPNADLSPGGPMVFFRWNWTGTNLTSYEWFFFFPISLVDRTMAWTHQFSFMGTPGGTGSISVTDSNDGLLAVESADYGHLFPYGYDITY